MATKTPNHKLIKPDMTDLADISMINPNWDTLDTALKAVESGSNENGGYVRFSDGTQMCWGTFTPRQPINTATESSSGGFRSPSEGLIFQHVFKDANYSLSLTTLNPTADADVFLTTVQVYEKSATSVRFFSVNPKFITAPSHKIEWQAIGRWK